MRLEWFLTAFRGRLLEAAAAVVGGLLAAAALPPLNVGPLAIPAPALLLAAVWCAGPFRAAFLGWLWGVGWALPAFWWLREIHPAIPWLLAPIISCWPAAWAAAIPLWRRTLLYPVPVLLAGVEARRSYRPGLLRQLALALTLAAWWTVLEGVRAPLFPWNFLAVSLWRQPYLLAAAAWAGGWLFSFLLVFDGAALALGVLLRNWKLPLIALLVSTAVALVPFPPAAEATVSLRLGAVQGDLSQRRVPKPGQELEALFRYLEGSRALTRDPAPPELIIWPETAVPVPLRSRGAFAELFRTEVARLVRDANTPLLLGVIDFEPLPPGSPRTPGITNSALLIAPDGSVRGRYDKVNRVPFGEFIPLRQFLPGFLIRAIDMNRDLVPGTSHAPLELKPGVRAGVAICYESVFATHARARARQGANLLLTLSNDAWYPTSSEPEQHLANAVLRSLETQLPQVRCGNNGGTLVLSAHGAVQEVLTVPGDGRPELRRGRGTAIFELAVPELPERTFYVRYGDWWLLLSLLGCGVAFTHALVQTLRRRECLERLREEEKRIDV